MLKRILFKLIFLDKFILRLFRKIDIGIIKINHTYIADIPKAGSSTLKNIAALKSKRYRLLKKCFNSSPMHSSISPVLKIKEINNEKKILCFIKSPEERLYSVFKEKVLENKMTLSYSLTKKITIFVKALLPLKTSFNKSNTFLDFCTGIVDLKKAFIKENYGNKFFDKHIIPQYDHIINLKKNYPNIDEYRLIFYPVNNLNNVIENLLEKKNLPKFNFTKKSNKNYYEDIKNTKIIKLMYSKDKILYKKLISSQKECLELNLDSFIKSFD